MLRRWILGLALLAALAAALLQGPQPAQATIHCMRIHAVMAGANGDTSIQYVELRLAAGLLTGATNSTKLLFFDASGNQTGAFTLGSTFGFSNTPGSILLGTAGLQAAAGVTPDFIIPANVIAPAGKIQFVHTTDCLLTGTIIDSVAYGSFTGTVDCGTTPTVALPTAGTQALTLQNLMNTCSDNSTEYALQAAAPRTNGGATGSFAPPPGAVGGIGGVAEGAVSEVDSAALAADGSGGPPYALIAGASAAAGIIAAGAWYARRRWLG